MKTIYLNKEFECTVAEREDTVQSIDTNFFDGKCNAFIEGYRFVPEGQRWVRNDGVIFAGEMVTPFKDTAYLEAVQTAFEELSESITNTELAIAELYEMGVTANG